MRDERTPKDVCGEASEYHAEQNRCRKLGVLPMFHSKAYLKIQRDARMLNFLSNLFLCTIFHKLNSA